MKSENSLLHSTQVIYPDSKVASSPLMKALLVLLFPSLLPGEHKRMIRRSKRQHRAAVAHPCQSKSKGTKASLLMLESINIPKLVKKRRWMCAAAPVWTILFFPFFFKGQRLGSWGWGEGLLLGCAQREPTWANNNVQFHSSNTVPAQRNGKHAHFYWVENLSSFIWCYCLTS